MSRTRWLRSLPSLPSLPSPLSGRDRALLRLMQPLVPAPDREEWMRSWAAELWCFHHSGRHCTRRGLSFGLVQDALWLRTESGRRALSGTALLCLLTLFALVVVAGLPALGLTGSWRSLGAWLAQQSTRFTIESALILLVSYATSSASIEQGIPGHRRYWLKACLFVAAKTLFLLFFAFLLSSDLCYPLEGLLPLLAALLQNLFFVLLALFGLRWSFRDGDGRCKQCLRSLAAPARVGRPSYNFLEWNGTELICQEGHGLLSIPELETSWCQSSAWVPQQPA